MPKQYLIGIDLGSSSVKASLFDSDGQAYGDVSRDNHPWQPRPGVAEYNGTRMLAATVPCRGDGRRQPRNGISEFAYHELAAVSEWQG